MLDIVFDSSRKTTWFWPLAICLTFLSWWISKISVALCLMMVAFWQPLKCFNDPIMKILLDFVSTTEWRKPNWMSSTRSLSGNASTLGSLICLNSEHKNPSWLWEFEPQTNNWPSSVVPAEVSQPHETLTNLWFISSFMKLLMSSLDPIPSCPLLFQPVTQVSPDSSMIIEWPAPPVIFLISSGTFSTFLGNSYSVKAPSPSWPCEFAP